jgi:hypothetical protein
MLLPAAMSVYSSSGRQVLSPLLWGFPPSTSLTSFPAPGCWAHDWLPPEPLWHSCLFIYSSGKDFLPQSYVLIVLHTLSLASLFFLMIITQFHFFPQVGDGLSIGLCCSGPGLSVGVPCTAKVTLSTSSQAIWAWETGGLEAILVSPFNGKWRCSSLLAGVEGSKFCLFLCFFLQGVSTASLQAFTIGGMLSASSL